VTQQPEIPRPDHDQADSRARSAWAHAAKQAGPLAAPEIHPSAHTPLASRAQARMARGAGRIWTKGSAFVRGDGLDWSDKAGRWFVMGIAGFVIEQTLATGAAAAGVSLGAGAVSWIGACWLYGGPHGQRALADHDHDDEREQDEDRVPPALPPGSSPYPPEPQPVAPVLPVGGVFQITDLGSGRTVVHHLGDAETPVPTPVQQVVEGLTNVQAARQDLAAALAVGKVGMGGSEVLGGGFTPTGSRWLVRLPAGYTIAHLNEKLENLESAWDLPETSALFTARDPSSKRAVVITRLDRDPLASVRNTPRVVFGSVSIRDPAPVAIAEDGSPVAIPLLRRHVGVVGGNGSGKTSLVWNALLHKTACPDAVYWLIDLQGSAAMKMFESTAGLVAWDARRAEALLDAAFEFAQARADELGANARAFIDRDAPGELDVNWEPTREAPQLTLVIEEASEIALAGLMGKVTRLVRLTRKCAVTVELINQRSDEKTMGDASIRKELTVKAAMRMDAGDVDMFLGKGMRAEGWLADRITMPGVTYLHDSLSATAPTPSRARSTYPDPGDVRAVIRACQPHRPRLEARNTRHLAIAVNPETLAEAVAAVAARMARLEGTDRVSVTDLKARLAARDPQWSTTDVARELRALGIEAQQSMRFGTGNNAERVNGYYLTQLDPENRNPS
jgi:hypothetical protein